MKTDAKVVVLREEGMTCIRCKAELPVETRVMYFPKFMTGAKVKKFACLPCVIAAK